MSRLAEVFGRARSEDRAALVAYLPAGFPSAEGGIAALTAMVEAGVDVVEVGLPYSDPLMDGPTIQAAVDASLRAGTRTADVLRTVEAVAATGAATLVMSYWNPVERYGVERFAADLAAVGGCGVITPDLTPDEARPWVAAARRADVDTVFLVAPSSTDERIAMTARACRGFVYAASTMGVTGARSAVAGTAATLVSRVRAATDLPVAVGLGVSTAAQAAEVAGYADGVIVGSAFVRLLLDAVDEDAGRRAVAGLAAELARGVRERPRGSSLAGVHLGGDHSGDHSGNHSGDEGRRGP
ncbi:MAG TPA: tryptophan synthase subunit alpha [Jiangellales bacterium]|nr:tryptophan synthase subunit alpha [Jiangellales bacterium]